MDGQQIPHRECPFCDQQAVTGEHIQDCASHDAQKKLHENGSNDAFATLFRNFAAIKEFGESYDDAPDKQKERMWICPKCYAFGSLPPESDIFSLPERCLGCGNVHIEAAMPYLARLFREE